MTFWSNIFIIIWYRVLFLLVILLSVVYVLFLHIFSCHILIVLKIIHCYLYGKFLLVRKIWNLPTLYILMWMGRPPLLMNHWLLALTLLTFNLGLLYWPYPTNSMGSYIEFLFLNPDIHLETLLIHSSSSPKISISQNYWHNITISKERCLKHLNHSNRVDNDLHNIFATLDPRPSSSGTSPYVLSFSW